MSWRVAPKVLELLRGWACVLTFPSAWVSPLFLV
jgi:hypothetical protein